MAFTKIRETVAALTSAKQAFKDMRSSQRHPRGYPDRVRKWHGFSENPLRIVSEFVMYIFECYGLLVGTLFSVTVILIVLSVGAIVHFATVSLFELLRHVPRASDTFLIAVVVAVVVARCILVAFRGERDVTGRYRHYYFGSKLDETLTTLLGRHSDSRRHFREK